MSVSVEFAPNTLRVDRLVKCEQGSEAWHNVRGITIGSSEAAAVFPGVSKTVTPADLRRKLRGEPRKPVTPYLQSLFDEGADAEPVLRRELEGLMGNCFIIESGIFQMQDKDVALTASLDGIAVRHTPRGSHLCVTEFKWRCGDGAGWGPKRDELGLTVWCQVQHQMHVANVPVAVIYSGARDGDRRMWVVKQAPPTYREMWQAHAVRMLKEAGGEIPVKRASPGLTGSVVRQLRAFVRETGQTVPPPVLQAAVRRGEPEPVKS